MTEVDLIVESLLQSGWVKLKAFVTKLLPDDTIPIRHQRFMVTYGKKSKPLRVAHNIDLAPRVPAKVGDRIVIVGKRTRGSEGEVIHWTHHNPRGGRGGFIWHPKGGKIE